MEPMTPPVVGRRSGLLACGAAVTSCSEQQLLCSSNPANMALFGDGTLPWPTGRTMTAGDTVRVKAIAIVDPAHEFCPSYIVARSWQQPDGFTFSSSDTTVATISPTA